MIKSYYYLKKCLLRNYRFSGTLFLIIFFIQISFTSYAQTRTVKGTVHATDDKEPMPGVSVTVKGTSIGTATDINGVYNLDAPTGATLVFSFIGYLTEEIQIGNRSVIDLSLAPDIKSLEEVVVIGYGTVKKSNVTGSIVSVKTEELSAVPTTNLMESLQGKLPGVDITRSSGQAGAPINIRVRGNRSLVPQGQSGDAQNGPLFIVDGFQYSHIQDLNPNDIASMEVLKDAASTAIYGSRGANGVIIVTTKQGLAGQTKVSINSYAGISRPSFYPKVMNPSEYAQFRREANRDRNTGSYRDDADIFNTYEMNILRRNGGAFYPDLLLQDGFQQDHAIGITSGTDKTKFYISANYFKETGIVKMDELNRYSIRANIDHKVNKRLTVGTQNQITYYDQDVRRDPFNMANKINPLLEPYDEAGNFELFPAGDRHINPLSDEQPNVYANNLKTTRVFTSGYLNYQILEGLTFRSNLGVTLQNNRRGIFRAAETIDRNGALPEAEYQTGNSVFINMENILTYTKKINDHSFTFTGVHTWIRNTNESQAALGRNQLLNYQLFYALGNATEQLAIRSYFDRNSLISYTGRVLYGYKDKYLLTITGRADAASVLTEGNKWAYFPSVSGAWRIIEEDFMRNLSSVSDLKIRLSYGVAGNPAVPAYSSHSLLTRIPFGFNNTPASGFGFARQIGSNSLGWEYTANYNAGIDFGIFGNKITGTIDLYNAITEDLLMLRQLPATSGAERSWQNIGKTQNKGVEIGLNAVAYDKNKVRWDLGLNWFANREQILELSTESNDVANRWFIGYPAGAFFDYEKIGIWQADEADQAAQYGQNPGDIRVKDQDGDGQIDANHDRVILGNSVPSWSANLSSNLKVGNFDVNLQFFARIGHMIEYEYANIYDPAGLENSLKHDYWTPENPTNAYPRPNASSSRDATLFLSSLRYMDGSFGKLRAATIGYTLPKSLTNKLSVSKLRIYVSGRNLAILSGIPDYDPERGGAMSAPIPRLYVGGINLEF